jgi:hypothetical protein
MSGHRSVTGLRAWRVRSDACVEPGADSGLNPLTARCLDPTSVANHQIFHPLVPADMAGALCGPQATTVRDRRC